LLCECVNLLPSGLEERNIVNQPDLHLQVKKSEAANAWVGKDGPSLVSLFTRKLRIFQVQFLRTILLSCAHGPLPQQLGFCYSSPKALVLNLLACCRYLGCTKEHLSLGLQSLIARWGYRCAPLCIELGKRVYSHVAEGGLLHL
jgi:hypothetical protein